MGNKEERAKREVESMHGKKAQSFSDNDPVYTDMCPNIYSSFLPQKSIYSSVFRSKSIYSSQKALKSIYSSRKNRKVCTLSTQDTWEGPTNSSPSLDYLAASALAHHSHHSPEAAHCLPLRLV
jgi:hypothetical protein